MNLADLHSQLKKLAEKVEAMFVEVALPQECATLTQAFTRLREIKGDVYVAIDIKMHLMSGKTQPEVEWTIWDGKNHFGGHTLSEALNKATAADLPLQQDTLDNVQNVLQQDTVSEL